ncbi:hypothetical protein J2X76_005160 [Neorhizobium sp. 2083]|uniref:hypothetical protein n=1 Tax=Neorhizobium sp. 2083 TaxID=2817762 RepID=UPI0028659E6F|nr:hypothetical protein [Neorhizobium sp. 2083]MDR6819963.1 hypothetical protein [Neorhizobium sp. 2083]
MYETTSEFYASANGDKWFLERGETAPSVIHRANPASGGAETRWSVDDFLKVAEDHPQVAALRNALAEPGGLEKGGNPSTTGKLDKAPTVYPWSVHRSSA